MKAFFKRFKWDETLRIDLKELAWVPQKPQCIGVCFNMDMFHPRVPKYWIDLVVEHVRDNPQNTYVFLTKMPERYAEFVFPGNAWLGTTWDGLGLTKNNPHILDLTRNRWYLERSKRVKQTPVQVKFLSLEPMLREPDFKLAEFDTINWIILGLDSRRGIKAVHSKSETDSWADDLISQARDLKIPVWVKKNFGYREIIRELPGHYS